MHNFCPANELAFLCKMAHHEEQMKTVKRIWFGDDSVVLLGCIDSKGIIVGKE